MEMKGVGREEIEKCLGSSHGPNWDVESLVIVVAAAAAVYVDLPHGSSCSCH
jgi:hypothetical protein